MKLTAVYVQQGDWIAAWIEEIPGVNTQGATLEEARENLRDALDLMLEVRREDSEKQLQGQRIVHRDQLTVSPW
jgi:predicted RNase H-like HicB family nuclease